MYGILQHQYTGQKDQYTASSFAHLVEVTTALCKRLNSENKGSDSSIHWTPQVIEKCLFAYHHMHVDESEKGKGKGKGGDKEGTAVDKKRPASSADTAGEGKKSGKKARKE